MDGSMRIFRMSGKRESGFTLMELMTTIAVFSILAMIAIPTFMSWLPEMRLNGAARQVMGDPMAARMNAVKENNEFKVFFTGTDQYKILDDDDNDGTDDTGEASTTKNIQTNYHGVTFTYSNDPIFYPRGTAWGTTVKVTNSSGSKYVKVAITGRVKIDLTP